MDGSIAAVQRMRAERNAESSVLPEPPVPSSGRRGGATKKVLKCNEQPDDQGVYRVLTTFDSGQYALVSLPPSTNTTQLLN